MRKFIKQVISFLDSTPAVYGKRQRGQSTLELALVSPLLVILLAGLMEIGWFARNYLELLEVTRTGAKVGLVQSGETHPLQWNNEGSLVPTEANKPARFPTFDLYRGAFRDCSTLGNAEFGFFNLVACIMQRSMDPLEFRTHYENRSLPDGSLYPDEIIISAFAVKNVFPEPFQTRLRDGDFKPDGLALALSDVDYPLLDTSRPQAIVVGRYPTNANECQLDVDGNPIPTGARERDPFDYIVDNTRTYFWADDTLDPSEIDLESNRIYIEVDGFDANTGLGDDVIESQVGFVWAGQHSIPDTGCIGSEWTLRDVEDLINLQNFNLDFQPNGTDEREYIPSQGLILVEMYWRHETLSQFVGLAPVLSPVFAILGEDTTVHVWAAYPLPSVEPHIEYE